MLILIIESRISSRPNETKSKQTNKMKTEKHSRDSHVKKTFSTAVFLNRGPGVPLWCIFQCFVFLKSPSSGLLMMCVKSKEERQNRQDRGNSRTRSEIQCSYSMRCCKSIPPPCLL